MKTTNIYQNIEYKEDKPAITVLFETSFTKEIRIAMKKEQAMKEHQTPYPIVIQIIDGEIDFGVKGNISNLVKGDLIALDGNVPHNLKATADSIIRLTLTKSDETNRVKNVVNS